MQMEEFEERVKQVRPRLLAFARLQLEDESIAEDRVQDALLSAMQSLDSFSGQSKFETWLFGILKYKILDEIRHRTRHPSTPFDADAIVEVDEMFDERSGWAVGKQPENWVQPESACSNDQFWKVFDICVFHLPTGTARVFTMRELLGVETAEICSQLELTQQNVWVMLHRARLKLRGCLEDAWFTKEEAS